MENLPRNYLLYDGDCPFCTNYVRMVQLRKAVGPVALLNMRDHPDLAASYRAQGYDLNDGMLPVSYTHLDVYKRQPFRPCAIWSRMKASSTSPGCTSE